jgi:hypothetical protein
MGNEIKCAASIKGARHLGKALLETAEVVFRPAAKDGPRVKLAFKDMKQVRTDGGELVIEAAGGPYRFELGAAAAKWAAKIANPPSRLDKLGVKPGLRAAVLDDVGGEGESFVAELVARGATVTRKPGKQLDLVFLAAESRQVLARLGPLRGALQPAGALWVVRPKGAAEITEGEVMAAGKQAGLVDVKVVAFSPTHTAEKLVIPVSRRE